MDLLPHSNEITHQLLLWYQANKRSLPWRETTDPYRIWISEIILQQTRVEQGRDYYLRFIQRFPDVHSLASAGEQEVLKLWQGLGYYSRARHLHQAARMIVEKYPQGFPDTYEALRALPGIGEYTAAAILSIAFDQPCPVVDGNVMRVTTRIAGIDDLVDTAKGKKRITDVARKLIPPDDPGTFNQAVMEFGALYCIPAAPDCEHCILKIYCTAYRTKRVRDLPVRKPKSIPANRYFHYLVIRTTERPSEIVLKKRTGKDIWRSLFDFPLIEANRLLSASELIGLPEVSRLFMGSLPTLNQYEKTFRHVLSHQLLHVRFFEVEVRDGKAVDLPENCYWILSEQLRTFPMPRLITRYLEAGG
jgi:A/G-specific adenine glycosylase